MKKLAIAGASVALAAMPVVGVFADTTTSITDNFSVGIADTCELGSHDGGDTTGQSYSVTNQAVNTLVDFDGQDTVLAIVCNKTAGYKITPVFSGLSANSNADHIDYSATTATAGSGTWTATYVKTTGGEAQTAANFTNNTAVTGTSSTTDYFTITYKVGIGADQAGGTYTGSAQYTLAVNS